MKQVKRWAVLAVSVTALAALMIPSIASAARLEQPKGTLVPTGTEVILTSTNLIEHGTSGLTSECQKAELRGVLTTNNGKEVGLAGNEQHVAAEHCWSQLGAVEQTLELTDFRAVGISGNPGTGSIGFTTEWKGACEMRDVSSNVTWNGTSQVHVVATVMGGCGQFEYVGDFTVTNNSGQELILSNPAKN